jgi:hypothetical protein
MNIGKQIQFQDCLLVPRYVPRDTYKPKAVYFWDRCYDFLNIFAEKFFKKLAFLTQNKAKF